MENKSDLAKIALAALILASTSPVNAQAGIEANGIVLAAGCQAHGCSSQDDNNDRYNNSRSAPYETKENSQPYSNPTYNNSSNTYFGEYNQPNTTQSYYNQVAVVTQNPNASMTEADLLVALNAQGRAIYLSLDSEGKALALQLANQESYRDKNLAVKEAQRRINERRSTAKPR